MQIVPSNFFSFLELHHALKNMNSSNMINQKRKLVRGMYYVTCLSTHSLEMHVNVQK